MTNNELVHSANKGQSSILKIMVDILELCVCLLTCLFTYFTYVNDIIF